MSAYAALADVQARLGGRRLDASSKPSSADVETWLLEGTALLNATLQGVGLPAPYTSGDAVVVLRAWVVEYAVALVLDSQALGRADPNESTRVDKFYGRLADIKANPSTFAAILSGGGSVAGTSRIRGSNTDGAIAPEFERGTKWT